MGFPPQQVDRMSLWQFQAAYAGWAEANGATVEEDLSEDEWKAAEAAFDEAPDSIR